MKITAFKDRNLLILAVSLSLLFFGWNAAEQHWVSFYETRGVAPLAYQSLALVYATIVLGNSLGPSIVARFGLKKPILLGFLSYLLLVLAIPTRIAWLVLLLSIGLGIGAGISGIAQIDFLRRAAPRKNRGEYSGTLGSLRTLGGFLGVFSVSFLLKRWSIETIYYFLTLVMVGGIVLLLKLPEFKKKKTAESCPSASFKKILRMLNDKRVLLLIPQAISGGFLLGLVLSTVPVLIKTNFGLSWVGAVTSLWHLTLAVFSIGGGVVSDLKGRFPVIYASILMGILAVVLLLSANTLPVFALIMVLIGLQGSLGSAAGTALNLDLFEDKIKEASAALGVLSLLLGTVPSFLLNQFLAGEQMFLAAIFFSIVGGVCLRILETKFFKKKQEKGQF